MRKDRKVLPGWVVFQRIGLLLFAGGLAVYGCGTETLYDSVAPDTDPPEVAITVPTTGSQVQAGQRVPISVAAIDPEGVSSITIRVTGVVSEVLFIEYSPPRTTAQADTAVLVPAGSVGSLLIGATAMNAKGASAQSPVVSVSVTTVDQSAPFVSMEVETQPRMELTDSIRVTVRAYDNPGGSGIASTALTAIVTNTAQSDTFVVHPTREFAGQPSDTAEVEYLFTPPFVDNLNLPDTLSIHFYGFAYDKADNCGASVKDDYSDQVACDSTLVGGVRYPVAKAPTDPVAIVAVSGRTSLTPGGGTLADLLVDSLRSRVYVSNLSQNRIQTLQAGPGDWGSEMFVGADPWGLALNARGDSLFVANSGGTSISFVSLVGTPREDLSRRYVTQNTPLWEINREVQGADSLEKLDGVFIDYSDRPQFIAQDAVGRLLYSTRPTGAASEGTIRVATKQSNWAAWEAKILLLTEDIEYSDTTKVAIAHVDSLDLYRVAGADDRIEIFDHKPGFPNLLVRSGVQPLDSALMAMSANPDSDILWAEGTWIRERLGLQDTTFVAASGDREWVAFGEGGTPGTQAGRITLWDASAARIHRRLLVADLVSNASERVTGLGLNRDGTLGAARGQSASYYWSTDLRLQGSVPTDIEGGAGAALHPAHPSFNPGMPSSERSLSFVGQADNTVRILDTAHFTQRGQLHIRDKIVGPLKAGPPLPTDNAGAGGACSGQDCVVVKLYGITDGGGIVVIDVRRRDIAALQ